MLKLLTFTTLYPNAAQPGHGIFVENRLRHLLASGKATTQVIAPVPWFPFTGPRFGNYGAYARVPRVETRHGVYVRHPRYPLVPKVSMSVSPFMLASGALREVQRVRDEGYDFDLIDAHYFYPDGVAAAMIARWLKKPFVITARGTDVNLIPRYRLARKMIVASARQAAAVITVCNALKDAIVELGAASSSVTVLRNGVDLERFAPPHDRDALRGQLGLTRPTLLSVGHLIRRKGHDLVIEAIQNIPGIQLVIAGEGPERHALREKAEQCGVGERVTLLGQVDHAALKNYYGAADALVLASSREGWANVLLEAMACGTPVVATRIWGTPEVVAAPEAGRLVERTPEAIATGIKALLSDYPDRRKTRSYAERFSWDETTDGQLRLFSSILGRNVPA